MKTTDKAVTVNTNGYTEMQIVRGESSGLIKMYHNGIIEFADDVSYEQWREILNMARTMRRKSTIAIASCISFAVKKWDSIKVDEALEQLEFEATLVKSALAINTVPRDLLVEELDPDHYVELAKSGINKKEMAKWIKIARDQRLTPIQLRHSIIEGEVVDRAAAKQMHTGVITIHGIRQEFDIWSRRVGGIEGVKAMDMDHKEEILEELASICEFGLQLNDHVASVEKVF